MILGAGVKFWQIDIVPMMVAVGVGLTVTFTTFELDELHTPEVTMAL